MGGIDARQSKTSEQIAAPSRPSQITFDSETANPVRKQALAAAVKITDMEASGAGMADKADFLARLELCEIDIARG